MLLFAPDICIVRVTASISHGVINYFPGLWASGMPVFCSTMKDLVLMSKLGFLYQFQHLIPQLHLVAYCKTSLIDCSGGCYNWYC